MVDHNLAENTSEAQMEQHLLKYPILLVHGLGMRDDGRWLKYWAGIPNFLEARGVRVFLAGQDAFGSVVGNAEQIKKRIAAVLEESGAEKVNLIAHSKGGLDCRVALLDDQVAAQVASLITLSTPHHGSPALEEQLRKYPQAVVKFGARAISLFYQILGDESPDAQGAYRSLLPEVCETLNQSQNEMPGLFVKSYAASFKAKHFGIPYYRTGRMVAKLEGVNDGLVSEKSARWQGFSGTLKSGKTAGVSHVTLNGRRGLDYPIKLEGQEIKTIAEFYELLLQLLAEQGC